MVAFFDSICYEKSTRTNLHDKMDLVGSLIFFVANKFLGDLSFKEKFSLKNTNKYSLSHGMPFDYKVYKNVLLSSPGPGSVDLAKKNTQK